MGMSGMYGPADRAESIASIHAALDAGITLLDTGDFYGMGHNEMLISESLKDRRREDVVLSVKLGALRGPDGVWSGYDSAPRGDPQLPRLFPATARHRPYRHLPPVPPRPGGADQ